MFFVFYVVWKKKMEFLLLQLSVLYSPRRSPGSAMKQNYFLFEVSAAPASECSADSLAFLVHSLQAHSAVYVYVVAKLNQVTHCIQ